MQTGEARGGGGGSAVSSETHINMYGITETVITDTLAVRRQMPVSDSAPPQCE